MITRSRKPLFPSLLVVGTLALAIAGCGGDGEESDGEQTTPEPTTIESNPDNKKVKLTVGSLDSTEELILGEIYAQGLEAAGYTVSTDFGLGSTEEAKTALGNGTISGFPDDIFTVLTAVLGSNPEDVGAAAGEERTQAVKSLEKEGIVAFSPTSFENSPTLVVPVETAGKLALENLSALKKEAQNLTVAGPEDCQESFECLAGLREHYDIEFDSFVPVEEDQAFEAVDRGDADLAFVDSTNPELLDIADKYRILNDDKQLLPAANYVFLASADAVEEAGPDFAETIGKVQRELNLPVMQELNGNVANDKESPQDVAKQYLEDNGYLE